MLACGPNPPTVRPAESAPAPPLGGREWTLVGLGESAAPVGAGGRPATIQFDPASGRAAGFAGCNRYSAEYTIAGDSLGFGPAVSTKMACADGDGLERRFLAALPEIVTYEISDSMLTLSGAGGPVARFRVR
jgi:putative lipoprotein